MPSSRQNQKAKPAINSRLNKDLCDLSVFPSTSKKTNSIQDSIDKPESLSTTIKALQQQNLLLKEILHLHDDAIFVKSASGKLLYANQATLDLYPSNGPTSLIGENIDAFFTKSQVDAFRHSDEIAMQNDRSDLTESIKLPDETEVKARVIKKRIEIENGEHVIACISKDISDKEALIENLQRSNEDLDNFAYAASHDLRAPLNVIKTLMGYVLEDCENILPHESKDNLALAMSRTHRMEKLLNDLLEYSRIGRSQKLPTAFNLRQKIFEWLDLIDLPMGFGIQCDDVDVFLPVTPVNIIMVNLINNAIKHHDSANANIQIKVRLNKLHTVLEVQDNGPGIPDKFKHKVFDLFQTLKSRDEVEASGIGLSVVKKIVLNYGGKIAIKDNTPRGSRFVIHWPTYMSK